MSFASGTTLIVRATDSGITMAADDLMYSLDGDGQAIPVERFVRKVIAMGNNILIGTAEMMRHPGIKYEFKDWISGFIEAHRGGGATNRPSDVASGLYDEMRKTLHAVESRPDDDIWKTYRPGERVVNYIVAGYGESFNRPYFFELGAELASDGRMKYVAPSVKDAKHMVWLGEDNFFLKAEDGVEPYRSEWICAIRSIDVAAALPQLPTSAQECVAYIAGLIKVESQFNPNKVGETVCVGVIDRKAKATCIALF